VRHEEELQDRLPSTDGIANVTHDPGDVVWFKEVSVRPLDREN